jgi:hypothetical protein
MRGASSPLANHENHRLKIKSLAPPEKTKEKIK